MIQEPRLTHAAQSHSEAMATHGFYRHVGADGSDVNGRVRAAGYSAVRAVYECLAAGQNTPERAVEFWKMQSPRDREVLLDPSIREIGVGFAVRPEAPYRYYWTVVLATP